MNNISMNQALGVWGDLWQAYFGKHPYGSNVAEIYAYRLMAYDPTIDNRPSRANIIHAQSALYGLVSKFASDLDCDILIDGLSPQDWMEQVVFDHRCHVHISHKVD